jgi:hypothetical protein
MIDSPIEVQSLSLEVVPEGETALPGMKESPDQTQPKLEGESR